MAKGAIDVIASERPCRAAAHEFIDSDRPSKILKLLHDASLTSLECFPQTWLRDDPSYLDRLQSEADRLRVWKNDYLSDDDFFDSFIRDQASDLVEALVASFCGLLDAIVRTYHALDHGSILEVILSLHPAEVGTSARAEDKTTYLPPRPDYGRYLSNAVIDPNAIISYIYSVLELCLNNFENIRKILLGSGPKTSQSQSVARTWVEHILRDETTSSASDLVADIADAVGVLFDLSCSLFWVPASSSEDTTNSRSGRPTTQSSTRLAQPAPSKPESHLFDIARQFTIYETPMSDAASSETKLNEATTALDGLLWRVTVLDPKTNVSSKLSNIHLAAAAMKNYSVALNHVVRLVPYQDLSPSSILWRMISFILDRSRGQGSCKEVWAIMSDALALQCSVMTSVNWHLRSYLTNLSCRHFLSKSFSSLVCFWCDCWRWIQSTTTGHHHGDYADDDIQQVVSQCLGKSFSDLQNDMEQLSAWLFRNISLHQHRELLTKGGSDFSTSEPPEAISTPLDIRLQAQLSVVATALSRRYFHGTLRWLSSESEVSLWLDSPGHNCLCIHAPARSGKSITAWYIAQRLVSERFWSGIGGPVTWFACSVAKPKRNHAAIVLKSIVVQIFRKYCQESDGEFLGCWSQEVSSRVKLISASHYLKLWDVDTIKDFRALFQAIPRKPVHIIIDGVDEYPDDQAISLLDFLDNFTSGPPLLKLLVTGQQIGHLAQRCQSGAWAGSNCLKYTLPLDRLQKDINAYIKTLAILRRERLDRRRKKEDISESIKELVSIIHHLNATTSVFVWANLIKEELLSCNSSEQLEELLSPGFHYFKTLKSLYIRFLANLEFDLLSRNSDLLSSIPTVMKWITCSRRPLTQADAFEIFKLCYPDKDPANKSHMVDLRYKFRAALARLKPLLRIERLPVTEGAPPASLPPGGDTAETDKTSLLQWVDPSFGSFLISQDKDEFISASEAFRTGQISDAVLENRGRLLFTRDGAHANLFQTCLLFLTRSGKGAEQIRGSSTTAEQLREQNPFLEYAACLWPYHVTQISGEQAVTCLTRLDGFLRSPESRRWMEVAITLQDSVEWLFTVKFMISRWAKRVRHPEYLDELHWVKDISGEGFREYEVILQGNPNEIHFADAGLVLPRTLRTNAGRDSVVPTAWPRDLPGDPIPSLFDFKDLSSRSHCQVVAGRVLSDQLVSGENADNACGFLSFDLNQGDNERGVFLIDRLCNHPRLVWECFGPARKRLGKSLASTSMKLDRHSLWETLSASLNPDGISVVAVFRENERSSQSPRVKIILWSFHASDDSRLISWKARFSQVTQSLRSEESVRGFSGSGLTRKSWQEVLISRPKVPSTEPLEAGADRDWADAMDVHEDPQTLPENWPTESKRYLAAFKDPNCLVTFRGLLSLDTQEYEHKFALPTNTADVVIVPGGTHLLRLSQTEPDVLEVWETDTFSVARRISSREVGEGLVFARIVDCSSSGNLVALTLEDEHGQGGSYCLAVLSLQTWAISMVYSYSGWGKFQVTITRAYFCQQDGHVAFVVRQPSSLGKQYSIWGASWAAAGDRSGHEFSPVVLLETLDAEPVGVLFPGHDRCPGDDDDDNGDAAKVAIFGEDRDMFVRCIPRKISQTLAAAPTTLPESTRSTILAQRNTCLAAMTDGHARVTSVFSTMRQVVDPRSAESGNPANHPLAVSIMIRWATWNLCLGTPVTVYDEPERARCGSHSYEISMPNEHYRHHGVALSPGLETLAWWLGTQIRFVRIRRGFYGAIHELAPTSTDDQEQSEDGTTYLCQGVTFSPSERFALSVWISHASDGPAEQRERVWARIHQLDMETARVNTAGPFGLSSMPSLVDFHPARDLAVVTLSDGGVHVFGCDYSADADMIFQRHLTTGQVANWLEIHGETNLQPSPRSTGKEGGAGCLDLRFSTCGRYLYSQGWHVFASVRDLFHAPNVPSGLSVLNSCFRERRREVLWKQPASSHPVVLVEDVLYSGEQHRFKVFRVRDYLVLGWSADAMNFFKPKEELTEPTWFRRVICAIPQSIGSQRAKVLWPAEQDLHVAAVFCSASGLGKPILPTVIFSVLKGSDMLVRAETDEGGNFVDGWLRGHAFRCPYHLKS